MLYLCFAIKSQEQDQPFLWSFLLMLRGMSHQSCHFKELLHWGIQTTSKNNVPTGTKWAGFPNSFSMGARHTVRPKEGDCGIGSGVEKTAWASSAAGTSLNRTKPPFQKNVSILWNTGREREMTILSWPVLCYARVW